MRALRVAYVLGTTEGGTGRHVGMLARGCAAAGAGVAIFGPAGTRALVGVLADGGPPAAAIRFDSVEISDRPRPARDLAAVMRLRRLLAAMAPDVVHAHGMRAGALSALALPPRRSRGRPAGSERPGGLRPALVVTVHNAPPAGPRAALVYGLLERLVARRARAVLCVSPDLEERLRRLGARQVSRAVIPAPPGAAAACPAVIDSGGRPVVLAAGRLAPQKGFGTLIDAAARWRDVRPEPLLVIAGTGPLAASLAGRASDLGVGVLFLGWRDDVTALLAAADVFVLPSMWEGQPLILQEALRAGRPVVASDVGGVRDLAGDEAALLVPPADPAALAAAVLRVLGDPALAKDMSAAAALRAAALPGEADAVAAALAAYTAAARAR